MTQFDPAISVIVCTYNRVDVISLCIDSLLEQVFENYEIIVVDNNSTDGTYELIEKKYHDKLRLIKELNQGLSFARNCGLKNAKGNIVAYIDDDAVADKNWLTGIYETFTHYPEAVCLGGKIIVNWMVKKPEWWVPKLDEIFSALDYGKNNSYLKYPHYPYGTNISFKRDFLLDIGGFNTNLGRLGKNLSGGEETELCVRIQKANKKIVYSPNAIVSHLSIKERIDKNFIRKRAYAHGKTFAYLTWINHSKIFLIKVIFKKLIILFWNLFFSLITLDFGIYRQNIILFKLGLFSEVLKLSFRGIDKKQS